MTSLGCTLLLLDLSDWLAVSEARPPTTEGCRSDFADCADGMGGCQSTTGRGAR
eukprot:CAMPEP_0185905988 /NCGR_PEP_ID=MMETSP0196C-20130402/5147_1 /TAXON_ID=2932 /ORGANISM="Alexandrium fundyense, Strain CCMP1719" /LENGTH=53 /DNA_ID=CAMNT_0028625635 /DNA_START=72 /DNA_END=229 /DNA_ORIENTATION=-